MSTTPLPTILRQLAQASTTEGTARIDGRMVTMYRILTTPDGLAALRQAADALENKEISHE